MGPIKKPSPAVVAGVAAILILTLGLRLLDAAERNTLTIDEPHYVGVGLYLWESGDYDFVEALSFHPPLTHHLASLALLPWLDDGLEITRGIGGQLLSGPDPEPQRIRWLSRLPFVGLACWGALLIFLWAREVAGPGAGLLALSLYSLSPTLLGHGFLVHSDIVVTVLFAQVLYTFWRWWNRPGALRFAVCGLSLGLALLSKLSALILLPSLGLLLLAMEYGVPPFRSAADREAGGWLIRGFWLPGLRASIRLAGLIAIATGVIWVGYGFSLEFIAAQGGPFPGVPLPSILQALWFDVEANTGSRSIYFFGEIAEGGHFPYLIPVAWALKTPVPVLILLGWALLAPSSPLAKAKGDDESQDGGSQDERLGERVALAIVAVVVAIFLGIVVFWLRVPLGLRYALPVIPLIAFFIGIRVAPLRGLRLGATCLLLAWLAVAGAAIHPHYLAHFNRLAGGPTGAHRFLVDSNLDWGQSLSALADELEARGNPPVWLGYFGPEPPERYGLRAKRLPGCTPVTGTVAISATLLRGLYSVGNSFASAPPGCYDWLLDREPVAQPGYSILLYEIPE
ncbi:MAG: glycosyltransferase family 39 protein [Myxococcota bacterium]|nr:glycosyltransferase family 39 protein [Myxococcota bacterium]